MNFIRRFWVFGLVLVVVGLHVAIIFYMRSELLKAKTDESLAVSLGRYRFQSVSDKSTIYETDMYLMLEVANSVKGREFIGQRKPKLLELIGQQLRQAETSWLEDPVHADLKNHLKHEVDKILNEDFVEEIVIAEWLEIPAQHVSVRQGSLAKRE